MTPFEGHDLTGDVPLRFEYDHESSADDGFEEPDGISAIIPEGGSEDVDICFGDPILPPTPATFGIYEVIEPMTFVPESTSASPDETRGFGDSPRSDEFLESLEAPGLEHLEPVGEPAEEWREYGELINAALRSKYADEQESLKEEITSFVALHPEHTEQLDTRSWDRLDKDVQAAARDIWTEAANLVAKAVTELNQRREFLDALQNWTDPTREASAGDGNRQRQFWAAMKNLTQDLARDLAIQLAKEALIEMLFPGAHVVLPPSGLVDAILTACTVLEIADEAD
ncbi:hypothetical protein [Micromonospora parva]|uniref:hypothetical protein n=1 Tax=Micromonospora parva TaxID=1464048 RepID=UPI0004C2A983|nr:hypothetical protein [Micromonospora parva]